ncbi:efflux RND transporter periplasmic adaptor subunit [Parvularcula lutaonensis]|uniref:Efflux RND transporter periplasmic adaptor subunit n=1 Tax=Parvularcula lutaonensis TaxID=491923 RepID=A0ABV7MCY8_9PROT|nr:efflux RND transporter periplasmic adaptor subunit [Parvularcula lutaonensis]GGY39152.1 hemolysin D [Parvularcula lutaonensis]
MDLTQEDSSGMRWVVIALGALGLGLLIYFGAGVVAKARDNARPPREESFPLVETVSARPVETLSVVEEGFLRPKAEVDVMPEVSGKVVEVSPKLEPGGRFAKGELLFRIDPRTFEADLERAAADLEAAKAELARAEAEAARQKRLEEIGATATSRRQQADAALASARARVGQAGAALTVARKRLEDTRVTAPFDASVISENVALGRLVQPGMAAATIFDTGAAEILLGLLPRDAEAVRRAASNSDRPLDVIVKPSRASASNVTLTGRVKRFGQSVDRQSRTVPVVIEVPDAFASDSGAFANDFVTVEIPAEISGQLFAAPLGTVREERFVWALDEEDRLRMVPVTPVQRTDTDVIFRTATDLRDERIVLTALTEEAEGLKVTPVSRSASLQETMQ